MSERNIGEAIFATCISVLVFSLFHLFISCDVKNSQLYCIQKATKPKMCLEVKP